MTNRLRVVLPPLFVFLTFFAVYALMECPFWFLRWRGLALVPGMNARRPSLSVLVFAALAYGFYRVAAFHPFYLPSYREWLSRTPWTPRKPLPTGPVALGWIDGIVPGGLALLAGFDHQVDPRVIVALALMSYATALTFSLFTTGAAGFGYATVFVMGLAVWLFPSPGAFLGAAIGSALIAYLGFRYSLASFPWSLDWHWRKTVFDANPRIDFGESSKAAYYGWPYNRLGPDRSKDTRIGLLDALLTSMSAGWWSFALCSLIDPLERRGVLFLMLLGGTSLMTLGRLGLYVVGYAPPIGLWGRIATFRWIIPGYDQVFVTPALTALMPAVGFAALRNLRLPLDAALPICLALMIFVSLSGGPSLKRWRLTGSHQIVPALVLAADQKSEFMAADQKSEFMRVG